MRHYVSGLVAFVMLGGCGGTPDEAVIGAANGDLASQSSHELEPGTSNPAEVSVEAKAVEALLPQEAMAVERVDSSGIQKITLTDEEALALAAEYVGEDNARRALTLRSTKPLYRLEFPNGGSANWMEETEGAALVITRGPVNYVRKAGETPVSVFQELAPGQQVPDEINALEQRYEAMMPVYQALGKAWRSLQAYIEPRESGRIFEIPEAQFSLIASPTPDFSENSQFGIQGEALTNGEKACLNTWTIDYGSYEFNIHVGPVTSEPPRIYKDDVYAVYLMACAFSGTVGWRVRHMTWASWSTDWYETLTPGFITSGSVIDFANDFSLESKLKDFSASGKASEWATGNDD